MPINAGYVLGGSSEEISWTLHLHKHQATADMANISDQTWHTLQTRDSEAFQSDPLQIQHLDDEIVFDGATIVTFDTGTYDAVGVDIRMNQSNSPTRDGTYTAIAAITGGSWSSINSAQGTIHQECFGAGDTDSPIRVINPAIHIDGTWRDMRFGDNDVGKWVKFGFDFRLPDTKAATITSIYGTDLEIYEFFNVKVLMG